MRGCLALDDNEQRAGVTFAPVCHCGFRFISSVLEMRGGLGGGGGGLESASLALECP